MYLYVDESGNFGMGETAMRGAPYMTFAVLVIYDARSRKAISQAVARTLARWKRRHQDVRLRQPGSRLIEELKKKNRRPPEWVYIELLKRMARKAHFAVYVIHFDKRKAKYPLPEDYMRRYSMLLLNILESIPVPSHQGVVTLTMDSQANARPSQGARGKVYSWRKRRPKEKRLRGKDHNRQLQLNNIVASGFRLRPRGTMLKVRHVRSHQDRCLQAADVAAYVSASQEKGQTNFARAYAVLKPKIAVLRRRTFLRRRTIGQG